MGGGKIPTQRYEKGVGAVLWSRSILTWLRLQLVKMAALAPAQALAL